HAADGADLQYHLDLARGVAVVELDALLRIYALERMGEAPKPLVLEQVRRARNDGMRLPGAVIDIRQHQPVGVGVLPNLQDSADHQLLGIPGQLGARYSDVLDLGDLKSGQRQPVRQLLDRDIDIDILFQPGKWNTHITSQLYDKATR